MACSVSPSRPSAHKVGLLCLRRFLHGHPFCRKILFVTAEAAMHQPIEDIHQLIDRNQKALERMERLCDIQQAYREGIRDGFRSGLNYALASMGERVN